MDKHLISKAEVLADLFQALYKATDNETYLEMKLYIKNVIKRG